ncbi:hypothetical protein DNTS_023700 [Danionella cerebrum]|uniref:Fibronectin type-III domain-containing protein n=1 Tax=Danionella cerebrum TaxID=2873325 RepID=A0A553MMN8_9TELE|nr:hypothetical protein DNTS_023700 [Danionella translucida]
MKVLELSVCPFARGLSGPWRQMQMRKEKERLNIQQDLNHSQFHTHEHMGRGNIMRNPGNQSKSSVSILAVADMLTKCLHYSSSAFFTVPPREPQVTCRSNTYPKGFYCSWHILHPTYIPTDFEVDVQHNQRPLGVTRDAVHKNRCHVKFPELFSSSPYYVNVTAVNSLGRASTTISFEESLIVKPDPPEKVEAKPIANNARRLEVTWNSPSTWPDVETFQLKYFLRYRPLIRDQWQHVSLEQFEAIFLTDLRLAEHELISACSKDHIELHHDKVESSSVFAGQHFICASYVHSRSGSGREGFREMKEPAWCREAIHSAEE